MKKCIKCDIKRCKAQCCTWVPFRISFLEQHQDKMVRPVLALVTDDREPNIGKPITFVEEITKDGKEYNYVDESKQTCPFLTEDYRCNIYKIRPEICKCFGTKLAEDHPFTCHFHLGKNYHFPDKGTPEFNKIDNLKYFNSDFSTNKKLLKEFFPGISEETLKEMIELSKLLNSTKK